jgi:XTP/dITP diphosphohydrolase
LLTLAFASGNPHKAQELAHYLQAQGLALKVLSVPHMEGLVEDAPDFAGNARLKVDFCLKQHAQWLEAEQVDWVLGDDSGYGIAALSGHLGLNPFPGVQSNRWLTPALRQQLLPTVNPAEPMTNEQKARAILALMQGQTQREAAYYCALAAYHRPSQCWVDCQGQMPLLVAKEYKGAGGFGYDPINHPVLPSGEVLSTTVAEWPLEVKNQHSHRAKALQQFVQHLKLPIVV